jgi:Fur family peroxide stress response transcriptional regulator
MKEKLNANAQAVLDIVRATHDHPTALEIYEAVKQTRPRIGLASIYRILHQLTERGYVKELGRSDESCRYDGQTSRHDHAVCTICGALIDVPVEIMLPQEVLQTAAQASGFTLSSHEIRLYGLCPSCLKNNAKLQ